jgi:hypothetical protein
MLGVGLSLDGRMLKDMHDSAWREIAEENRPRTQEELDDAALRKQHYTWMRGVLEDGVKYHEQQTKDKAARDLRAEADRITREFEQSKTPATRQRPSTAKVSTFPATITTR